MEGVQAVSNHRDLHDWSRVKHRGSKFEHSAHYNQASIRLCLHPGPSLTEDFRIQRNSRIASFIDAGL